MGDIKIVNELGPGKCFTDGGDLFTVLDIKHNKTAMRQMIVKIKVKNLKSGVVKDVSYTGGDKVTMVYLDKRKMNYLYDDGTFCVFMDNETYEQISIPQERLKWELNFLKDGVEATVTSYEGEVMGVELPVKIALQVVETEEAVKGDTINKAMKDAKLETGYSCKVPLFVKNGTVIYVRTDTGEYDSRA